jgi:hypothetical protein
MAGLSPKNQMGQMGKHLIYALVDTNGDGIRYIGKSSNGIYRPRQHLRSTYYNGPLKNTHLYNWVRKMISENKIIDIVVVEYCEKELCADREIYWIKRFREEGYNLCNQTDGGEGCFGRKVSEKTRAAISRGRFGKKMTEEQRKKLSIAHLGQASPRKGVKLSAEQKMKISQNSARLSGPKNPFFGKKRTEETKKRISMNRRGISSGIGRKVLPETRAKLAALQKHRKPVICHENGKEYPSIRSAARELGLFSQNIDAHLKNKNKYKQVGGFTFSLAQGEIL